MSRWRIDSRLSRAPAAPPLGSSSSGNSGGGGSRGEFAISIPSEPVPTGGSKRDNLDLGHINVSSSSSSSSLLSSSSSSAAAGGRIRLRGVVGNVPSPLSWLGFGDLSSSSGGGGGSGSLSCRGQLLGRVAFCQPSKWLLVLSVLLNFLLLHQLTVMSSSPQLLFSETLQSLEDEHADIWTPAGDSAGLASKDAGVHRGVLHPSDFVANELVVSLAHDLARLSESYAAPSHMAAAAAAAAVPVTTTKKVMQPSSLSSPSLSSSSSSFLHKLLMATRYQAFETMTDLIVVAGHAVFVGADFADAARAPNWFLESHQQAQLPVFLAHIEAGVRLARKLGGQSLLVFSGGETRAAAGPRSEAQSYWNVADHARWFVDAYPRVLDGGAAIGPVRESRAAEEGDAGDIGDADLETCRLVEQGALEAARRLRYRSSSTTATNQEVDRAKMELRSDGGISARSVPGTATNRVSQALGPRNSSEWEALLASSADSRNRASRPKGAAAMASDTVPDVGQCLFDWTASVLSVRWRAVAEERARDSFENLLFSMCRFREVTGRYPQRVHVIGFEFKRDRFVKQHRGAIRFPENQFHYYGIDQPAQRNPSRAATVPRIARNLCSDQNGVCDSEFENWGQSQTADGDGDGEEQSGEAGAAKQIYNPSRATSAESHTAENGDDAHPHSAKLKSRSVPGDLQLDHLSHSASELGPDPWSLQPQAHAVSEQLRKAELENAVLPFSHDPYGCRDPLASKRSGRNPFRTSRGYGQQWRDANSNGDAALAASWRREVMDSCPEMADLLDYCGTEIYSGLLPWDNDGGAA